MLIDFARMGWRIYQTLYLCWTSNFFFAEKRLFSFRIYWIWKAFRLWYFGSALHISSLIIVDWCVLWTCRHFLNSVPLPLPYSNKWIKTKKKLSFSVDSYSNWFIQCMALKSFYFHGHSEQKVECVYGAIGKIEMSSHFQHIPIFIVIQQGSNLSGWNNATDLYIVCYAHAQQIIDIMSR